MVDLGRRVGRCAFWEEPRRFVIYEPREREKRESENYERRHATQCAPAEQDIARGVEPIVARRQLGDREHEAQDFWAEAPELVQRGQEEEAECEGRHHYQLSDVVDV